MNNRAKIIVTILIIITAVVVVYFLIFRASPGPPIPTEPDEPEVPITTPTLPIAPDRPPEKGEDIEDLESDAVIKRISDNKAFDLWGLQRTREIFYIGLDGRTFRIREGSDEEISQQTISALNFTELSPNQEKALVAFSDPLAPEWGIFDLTDRVWRPLSGNIIQATWGENDEELIAISLNPEGVPNLVKINPIQQEESIIQSNFLMRGVRLISKSPDEVLIKEPPSSRYQNGIRVFNLTNNTLSLIIEPEVGIKLKFSPNKDYLLKTSSRNFPTVFDQNMSVVSNFPFEQIFPSKCAFANNYLYCFVNHSTWPANANLPEDYMMRKLYSVDALFRIDLNMGGIVRLLATGEGRLPSIDAKNPVYLNGKIYFINRYDNYIYELGF